MRCMRYIRLIFFLIFLGAALSIYFIQSGMLKVKKSTLAHRLSPEQYKISSLMELLRPNVSCQGAELTRKVVPYEMDNILERRANEYKQHQLRRKTNADIIIAPANSPLQYPMTGFRVAPLKKSLIPGLALQTQGRGITTNKREVYKVSLSVKSGVLSVEDVLDGDQVEGQGQSELTISSSNLTQLNDLLSRVTYTSTIYHIRTSDLVYFTFEDHKAIFPIMIRRPSVPVLYDPGKDINSRVTIITKTFLRYKELNVLIQSIRKFYPKIKIIVADDSLKPERVSGNNIEHYIMPPAQGWFAGRNLAVSQLTTKYFLWVDDDFVFLNETRIESFVEIMEALPELDVLGGEVSGDQFYFVLEYDEGDESDGGCLRRIREFHQPLPGYDGCFLVDGVINYFLARTDAVRRVGFDPFLKRVGHTDVEKSVSQLKDKLQQFCKEEAEKMSSRVKTIQVILTPEYQTREEFLQYFHLLTLDPNSVNNWLRLSEGNTVLTFADKYQPNPDHPDRFDCWTEAMCRESVTGRCYWEVEWSGDGSLGVDIGVTYKSISRKEEGPPSAAGRNDQSWSLFCSPDCCSFWHNNIETKLSAVSSRRIGVYVDHSAGILSFYSVSDTMSLIHRVQTTFTQPLCAVFGLENDTTVKLCHLTN